MIEDLIKTLLWLYLANDQCIHNKLTSHFLTPNLPSGRSSSKGKGFNIPLKMFRMSNTVCCKHFTKLQACTEWNCYVITIQISYSTTSVVCAEKTIRSLHCVLVSLKLKVCIIRFSSSIVLWTIWKVIFCFIRYSCKIIK